MSAKAAEHAQPYAYVVLDDHDRILHVSSALHADLGHWTGQILWEHLPSAEEVYGPSFADARATGRPVDATVFYSGRLLRLTAIPGADGLAVHVEKLVELDVTSLGTLTRTLAAIEDALTARVPSRSDSRARASLRALP